MTHVTWVDHCIDLFEYIEKNEICSEDVCHRIFTQLVSAVRYLARNQIIHRDIKDENIIIDPNLNIQLIGYSRMFWNILRRI